MHSLFEGGSTQNYKSIQGSQKLPGIIDFWRWISKTSLCKRWGMGVWHCFLPNIPKLQSRLYLLLMAEILRPPVEVGIVYPRIYRVKKHPNGGWPWDQTAINVEPPTTTGQLPLPRSNPLPKKIKGRRGTLKSAIPSADLCVSKNRGTSKWMVYNGKLY